MTVYGVSPKIDGSFGAKGWVFVWLAVAVLIAPPARADEMIFETEPADVHALVGQMSAEVAALQRALGVTADQRPAPAVSEVAPFEVYLQARTLYEKTNNLAFEQVIRACAEPRGPHEGTWLLPEMIESYVALNAAGHAHSIEVWLGRELIGGLYGISIGQIFFGESMFSRRTDASKVALSRLTEIAFKQPFQLIDCQIYTEHLANLGGRELSRQAFQQALETAVAAPSIELGQQPRRPAADLGWAS